MSSPIWIFGEIPLVLFAAIFIVLVLEIPAAYALFGMIDKLITWIKDHETD